MNYHKLNTRNFLNKAPTQNVDDKVIIEALDDCYKNTAFSTFPYLFYNMNSKTAIKKLSSGNCVALSMYVKNYLWKNYRIKSFLIPATIPNMYKLPGLLEISHVALAIPKNKSTVFIADAAFYFLNPITFSLKNKDLSPLVFSKKIYTHEPSTNVDEYKTIEKVQSKRVVTTERTVYNEYQSIPKNTTICECSYITNPEDTWRYILREVTNPDRAISTFFLNVKKRPFICSTKNDCNSVCIADTHVRLMPNNKVNVSYESGVPQEYGKEDINDVVRNDFKKRLEKFIPDDFVDFLFGVDFDNMSISVKD